MLSQCLWDAAGAVGVDLLVRVELGILLAVKVQNKGLFLVYSKSCRALIASTTLFLKCISCIMLNWLTVSAV